MKVLKSKRICGGLPLLFNASIYSCIIARVTKEITYAANSSLALSTSSSLNQSRVVFQFKDFHF